MAKGNKFDQFKSALQSALLNYIPGDTQKSGDLLSVIDLSNKSFRVQVFARASLSASFRVHFLKGSKSS